MTGSVSLRAAVAGGPIAGSMAGFCRALGSAAGLALAIAVSAPATAETVVYEPSQGAAPDSWQEGAYFAEKVNKGELPPVSERLPATPLVVTFDEGRKPGRPGGEFTTMVTRSKDTRLFTVYGYARLVGYNAKLELEPDILERVEVTDGRDFTFKLRKGHRWSDGHPFTSEDFRYYWEDVANDPKLSPGGLPLEMLVKGEAPQVTFPDETTVRYVWSRPNPYFLPALAGARPLFLYRPAHYMKQFHARYADDADLKAKEAGVRSWAALHNRRDNLYRCDNPELPTLQPWRNTVAPPSTRFVGERNPYFHRVDSQGHQLPYLDRVILNVVGGALVAAKTGAGESDLQARGLSFTDYTFLKSNEERSKYRVNLWRTVRGSQLALYPNLNVSDPVWREVLRDVRFRRALSLAIDRSEINQVIYFGLTLEGNNTVLPGTPLYDPSFRQRWANFDLDQANALLDEMGLGKRNDDGLRLLPDGRPLAIIVESAGENSEEADVLELIHDTWLKTGIKLYTKPMQREVLRNRVFAGETVMAIWFGYENGVPTAEMSPQEFVPMHQQSFHWPKWGQYAETSGKSGEPVDMERPKRLLELFEQWLVAAKSADKDAAWREILQIHAEDIYTIGLTAQVPQPVVVAKGLNNVPTEAMFNWEPGAQFGIYRPDQFWLER